MPAQALCALWTPSAAASAWSQEVSGSSRLNSRRRSQVAPWKKRHRPGRDLPDARGEPDGHEPSDQARVATAEPGGDGVSRHGQATDSPRLQPTVRSSSGRGTSRSSATPAGCVLTTATGQQFRLARIEMQRGGLGTGVGSGPDRELVQAAGASTHLTPTPAPSAGGACRPVL